MFYVQFFIRKSDFLLIFPFWPLYGPGTTQPVVEMSTKVIPCGVKVAST